MNSDYYLLLYSSNSLKFPAGTLCFSSFGKTERSEYVILTSLDNEVAGNMKASQSDLHLISYSTTQKLLPLSPKNRLRLLRENTWILEAIVGDFVLYDEFYKGIIAYIGPLVKTSGYYFGVVLRSYNSIGNCDGSYEGIRYFEASSQSSIFATADKLKVIEIEFGRQLERKKEFSCKHDFLEASNLDNKKERVEKKLEFKVGDKIISLPTSESPEYGIVKWMETMEDNLRISKNSEIKHHPRAEIDSLEDIRENGKTSMDKDHRKFESQDFQTNQSSFQFRKKSESRKNEFENLGDVQRKTEIEEGVRESSSSPSLTSPIFDLVENYNRNNDKYIEVGTLVQLSIQRSFIYGVVKWIGYLHNNINEDKMAGIEIEEKIYGGGNGEWSNKKIFSCLEGRGVFVPFSRFSKDTRFDDEQEISQNESFLTPIVGFIPPITSEESFKILGRNKGIQGCQNSCYLDATLFTMFAFTSVFDCLLYRPPNEFDIPEYLEVQRVLREEIVNPLRSQYFVHSERVMKLRHFLDNCSSIQGLLSEEKDPEELLNSLLCQTLKASPFLELSSGQTAHTYQLFVEKGQTPEIPTVQELFEASFLTSAIKLKKIPGVLILQLPRFGKTFKLFDRILPSQILDVTDIIENSPRQCIICGKLALFECMECFGVHGNGMDSTAFCRSCHIRTHLHRLRQHGTPTELNFPSENYSTSNSHPRLYMELFAILSIETSHYVTFAKCGPGPSAPWCFFDSMADRKGEINGYNIPEVRKADDITYWFTDEGMEYLKNYSVKEALPEHGKRLLCDGYMCFYQSPNIMMYQ